VVLAEDGAAGDDSSLVDRPAPDRDESLLAEDEASEIAWKAVR
jgi:hypothetical protein